MKPPFEHNQTPSANRLTVEGLEHRLHLILACIAFAALAVSVGTGWHGYSPGDLGADVPMYVGKHLLFGGAMVFMAYVTRHKSGSPIPLSLLGFWYALLGLPVIWLGLQKAVLVVGALLVLAAAGHLIVLWRTGPKTTQWKAV